MRQAGSVFSMQNPKSVGFAPIGAGGLPRPRLSPLSIRCFFSSVFVVMVRPKASGSKKSKRAGGVDFKKIKHKIGRKLPPPKNATNTQIKSKAIVLPEQSVVSERSGLAVSSRGLTLRELLQQTSHHSTKTRKCNSYAYRFFFRFKMICIHMLFSWKYINSVALTSIRDLLLKHPSELKLHKLIIIEKLRERICDNDRAVRETLYHLLKTVIFPGIKEIKEKARSFAIACFISLHLSARWFQFHSQGYSVVCIRGSDARMAESGRLAESDPADPDPGR
ncbi:hypothetical protein Taro_026833, partial [Colocasia esculenta]|nr:hypothetical protein [Colocasia esculenta]